MGVMVWDWTESGVNGLVLGLRVGLMSGTGLRMRLMLWYWD